MRVLFFTFAVVLIDQISKLFVKGISLPSLGINFQGFTFGSTYNLLGDFFQLTFIENPGMAFGLEIGGKIGLTLFRIAAVIIIVYFIYINRNENLNLRIALSFILGGAIGNLIDRMFYGIIFGYAPLFYGKVVDFMKINVPDFTVFGKTFDSWPIFNVADLSVSVGFVMILLGYKKIFYKEIQPQPLNNLNSDSQ